MKSRIYFSLIVIGLITTTVFGWEEIIDLSSVLPGSGTFDNGTQGWVIDTSIYSYVSSYSGYVGLGCISTVQAYDNSRSGVAKILVVDIQTSELILLHVLVSVFELLTFAFNCAALRRPSAQPASWRQAHFFFPRCSHSQL